jgi:signal transduction histidine kinase
MDVAERQVKRLASLVHQLLDVSRLAAGRLALELEQFDLVDLVRDVASRFADEEARGGSSIAVVADGPIEGRWDKLRIDQVLTNLLTNAVRYGQREPVDVTVAAENGLAVLRVRDRGIGIALEDQGRIFERFERAAPLRNYGGVGLGLWIVKELVAALGGNVSVTSEPGEGATFTVELPLDAASHLS